MAAPLVPIAIGAAALLGLLYLGGSAKAAKPKAPTEDSAKTKLARDAGYAAGTARAAADVAAGQPEDLNPTAPAADAKASGNAAAYQTGFHDGYVDGIAAAAAAAKITKESAPGGTVTPKWHPPGPPSGLSGSMREGETAREYGYRRGRGKAKEDCEGGYEGDASAYYDGANFKARQAESGDAAAYKQGFKSGYELTYASCLFGTIEPTAGVGRTSAGGVATGFANAIGGVLSSVGVGAMAPRMMVSAPPMASSAPSGATAAAWKAGEARGYAQCKKYEADMAAAAGKPVVILPPMPPVMLAGDVLGAAWSAGWKFGYARCMREVTTLYPSEPAAWKPAPAPAPAPSNMMMARRTTGGLGAIAVPIQGAGGGANMPAGRGLMGDCYDWGFKRALADGAAGRSADHDIVGHSDVARAPGMSEGEKAACATEIVRGYYNGWARNRLAVAKPTSRTTGGPSNVLYRSY